jgi:formylglycine-generating enzyme required for sulfatase activity
MNTNFVEIIKRIIAEQGEDILADAQRVKGFVQDYAARESKIERLAFTRCIEYGAYTELKNAPDVQARIMVKAAVAQKVHSNEGMDVALCNDALDVLEAALFGEKNLCQSCGKELHDGWVSCPYCGTPQAAEQENEPAPAPVPQAAPSTPQTTTNSAPAPRKKHTKRNDFIAAVVFVALIVIVIVIIANGESGSNSQTNTPAVSAIPADFVRIEGGTFTMGSPSTEVSRFGDETQHQVKVNSFYMGKYEVTQAEYEAVMGTNPSSFKGAKRPVETVSWFDAVEYCNKRSAKEGLSPAYTRNGDSVTWNRNATGYRLPTESEWEYACRAGTATPFSTGSNITTAQANYNGDYPYNGNAKGTYREKTTEAGTFAANRWGLHDMHGNVWEWCWDWYGSYPSGAQSTPDGAVSGARRVGRGGSWILYGRILRSAYRGSYTPSYRYNNLGFRLVRP